MTVLRDATIHRLCEQYGLITPFNEDQLQPASYDVTLASELLAVEPLSMRSVVDSEKPSTLPLSRVMIPDRGYVLRGKSFVLAATVEAVRIPRDLVGRIEGKSSRARTGLQIHSAGYLDPGFHGNVTLEIVNFLPYPIRIRAGMRIGQISFEYLDGDCERAYGERGNRYQDSVGVVAARPEAR